MMSLYCNVDLNAGPKTEGKMVVVYRHPFEQLPDKSLVILLDLCLLGVEESLDLVYVTPDIRVVGVFQKKVLLLSPDRIDLLKNLCVVLVGVCPPQQFLFQVLQPGIDIGHLGAVAGTKRLLDGDLKPRQEVILLGDDLIDGLDKSRVKI